MEILLLDTTEKEGDDNMLYHYSEQAPLRQDEPVWLSLRGVLAAAMGATSSFCGEPLQAAHFRAGKDRDRVVGFANLYEVLYILVFPRSVPSTEIVQYYTRSSCDLLLSFFGYPDQKLSRWQRRNTDLTQRLNEFFIGVFATIEQDLSFKSHFQFAFKGWMPALEYPLDLLAKLSTLGALQKRGSETDDDGGFCILHRSVFEKQLVASNMRRDLSELLYQWVVFGRFQALAKELPTPKDCPWKCLCYEFHDFQFARHGFYPRSHSCLLVEHEHLQIIFLNQLDMAKGQQHHDDSLARWQELIQPVPILEIIQFVDTNIAKYCESQSQLHHIPRPEVSKLNEKGRRTANVWYCLVVDHLRSVILGPRVEDHFQGFQNQTKLAEEELLSILISFIGRIASFQNEMIVNKPKITQPDPRKPTWLPRVKLDCDDPSTLFLHEQASESGADISAENAHIFPRPGMPVNPSYHHLQEPNGLQYRALHQEAERIDVNGRKLWVVANHYETMDLLAIFDDSMSMQQMEQEMDRVLWCGLDIE